MFTDRPSLVPILVLRVYKSVANNGSPRRNKYPNFNSLRGIAFESQYLIGFDLPWSHQ